jgi:glutamate-ammonia-ligase adenylyltransferase
VLSALADATLERAVAFAMRERGLRSTRGLAVIAMGKLGGREIGYGSDLDVLFVHETPDREGAAGELTDLELFARIAQRVLRLVDMPHEEGPGYELDTRLRPSGSQGLLVVSLDAFARYQAERAQGWERQALVKARSCAGDAELGERVIAVARRAAYEGVAPTPNEVHRLRMRMQVELGRERLGGRPARYDLKVGRGGLADVELAVQWLQMRSGRDPSVRTGETESAIAALESCGALDSATADTLREGWRFLRRLEQRLRISHGSSATLLEEGAPGLAVLARRMGMRETPRGTAEEVLLARYVATTRDVRAAYLRVLGIDGAD